MSLEQDHLIYITKPKSLNRDGEYAVTTAGDRRAT